MGEAFGCATNDFVGIVYGCDSSEPCKPFFQPCGAATDIKNMRIIHRKAFLKPSFRA